MLLQLGVLLLQLCVPLRLRLLGFFFRRTGRLRRIVFGPNGDLKLRPLARRIGLFCRGGP